MPGDLCSRVTSACNEATHLRSGIPSRRALRKRDTRRAPEKTAKVYRHGAMRNSHAGERLQADALPYEPLPMTSRRTSLPHARLRLHCAHDCTPRQTGWGTCICFKNMLHEFGTYERTPFQTVSRKLHDIMHANPNAIPNMVMHMHRTLMASWANQHRRPQTEGAETMQQHRTITSTNKQRTMARHNKRQSTDETEY